MNNQSSSCDDPSSDFLEEENSLPRCFVCSLPVLGLVSDDQYLDTFCLSRDDEALRASAFGWSHTLCLLNTQWGKKWANYRLRHYSSVRRHSLIYSNSEWKLLHNHSLQEFVFIRTDGLFFCINQADLSTAEWTSEGFCLSISDVRQWNLAGFSPLATTIKEQLFLSNHYPLIRLLDALGISSVMMNIDRLKRGKLMQAHCQPPALLGDSLVARAEYPFLIPLQLSHLVPAIQIKNEGVDASTESS